MTTMRVPLKLRLKLAGGGLMAVLRRLPYVLLAAGVTMIVMGVLLWLLNFNLLLYIFSSPVLSTGQKLKFLIDGYGSVFTNFEVFSASALMIISLLMGLNTAATIYVGRSQAAAAGKKGAGAMVAALVGSGCAVCGTSALGPVLTGLAGGAAASTASAIGYAANLMAILLLVYSLIGLGVQAANVTARAAGAGDSGAQANAQLPSE